MNWTIHQKFYYWKSASKKKAEIEDFLKGDGKPGRFCLLSLSSNKSDLFDVYPSSLLIHNVFKERKMVFIGAVSEMKETGKLVEHIFKDVYKKTASFDVREWFFE